MVIQRSRSLSASTFCAIALCIASCNRAGTRQATQGALEQPALGGTAPLGSPPLSGSAAPEPSAPKEASTVASSREPSEVGAGDEGTGELDGAAPGSPGPMPMLNQLLTTQALLVSLLLTPLAKAPPEPPPVGNEPAPPAELLNRR